MRNNVKQILDNALLNSNLAWWEWDIKNNYVQSNDLKVTMLGFKPENFKNAGYQAYTDLLHPEDYERTMQAMRDHLEGKAPLYQVDYRIMRSDMTYTWYMDRGGIIERDKDQTPLKVRGIVLDLGPDFRKKQNDRAALLLIRRILPSSKKNDLVVFCSSCKKIKLSKSTWMEIDDTFETSLLEQISYGICPECIKLLYPELEDDL